MSSKSLLKATGISVSSPTRLGSATKTPTSASSPRSILKRPPPLLLSPYPSNSKQLSPSPLVASITVLVSPSKASPTVSKPNRKRNLTVTVRSPSSPHVHFPSSPNLTSTFVTHCSECYDRSAIKVSPNPLEIPSWGSRIYSPSTGNFRDHEKGTVIEEKKEEMSEEEDDGLNGRRFGPPKGSPFTPTLTLTSSFAGVNNSPLSQSFTQVPFSPRPNRTRASIRFQNITTLNSLGLLQPLSAGAVRSNSFASFGPGEDKDKRSLKAFPRSPYPTAPTSPIPEDSDVELSDCDVVPLSPLPSAPVTSPTPRNRSWMMSPPPNEPGTPFPSFSLVLDEAGSLQG